MYDDKEAVEAVARAICAAGHDDWSREGVVGIDVYRDMATAAIQALRSLAPPGEWLPIESAPRDGSWIMLYSHKWPISCYPLVGWSDGPGEEWQFPAHPQWASEMPWPTHWRPLPPPPGLANVVAPPGEDVAGIRDAIAALTQAAEDWATHRIQRHNGVSLYNALGRHIWVLANALDNQHQQHP